MSNGKFLNPTPIIDDLENGPWPSFISGFKELAERKQKPMLRGVMDQLEYSYKTKLGYWKGGVVGVQGYGSGIISRYSMISDKFPEATEFHTVRVQPAPGMHYSTKALRDLCDIWDKHGSGIMSMHGQTGNLQFQGIEEKHCQEFFDDINQKGWDLGGAGATVRTGMSCVGMARCEQACYDTLKAHHKVLSHFTDFVHRPELPYKVKFKFSGCPNDCMNSIQRSDMAVIGIWKDKIDVDQGAFKEWMGKWGNDRLANEVIALCPTRCITVEGDKLNIDSQDCVRCMHCLNVMPEVLSPGKERGATLLVGGKGHLKVGNMLGSMMIPFMPMETDQDIENFVQLANKIIEWWCDNGLDHERVGECIERVGIYQFLEDIGLEPNVDMVLHPRDNPYFKAEY
ncbi:MAG: dissimilatory-type sulfite reductase subunit alpha [Spirochaetota bacterium]|nr:dissimilatory-type sulfite reductase subunit alpha [Spirochaetota bacterium]